MEIDQRRAQDNLLLNDKADDGEISIDLMELFYRLLENARYIIATTVLAIILAAIYTFMLVTPMFESTAKLYVLNSNDSALNLSDLQIGTYLASDYQEVFKTWEVNEQVIQNLGLDYTYDELEDMVSVTNPSNTRILYITVKSSDPMEATLIANEFAKVVRDYIYNVMDTEKPNILSDALKPTVPVSPNKTMNLLIGALLGAFIAIGVITVRFILDDKIKSSDDILRFTGMPTLAVVPVLNGEEKTRPSAKGKSKKTR